MGRWSTATIHRVSNAPAPAGRLFARGPAGAPAGWAAQQVLAGNPLSEPGQSDKYIWIRGLRIGLDQSFEAVASTVASPSGAGGRRDESDRAVHALPPRTVAVRGLSWTRSRWGRHSLAL